MAELASAPVEWNGFTIENDDPNLRGIVLEQMDEKAFRLRSTVRYHGDTGLAIENTELRYVNDTVLGPTDLASVPGPFRWWANSYGTHTPAALIHDRFIGAPPDGQPGRPDGVSEQNIDRYFRFMMHELGVPFLRRWLMWGAVAVRTRLAGNLIRKISMIAWIVVALAGVALAVVGVATGELGLVLVAAVLPLPASLLWGAQAGAGLIIAYVGVPFLAAPSILAFPAGVAFRAAEFVVAKLPGRGD
ncbi:MAG: DUF1353 domain-containing protein [Actinomycetota bacterium]